MVVRLCRLQMVQLDLGSNAMLVGRHDKYSPDTTFERSLPLRSTGAYPGKPVALLTSRDYSSFLCEGLMSMSYP